MKKEKKNLWLVFLLLIIGSVSIIFYHLYFSKEKTDISPSKSFQEQIEENIYQIGNIVIDKNKGEISFSGKVVQNSGWVQFLIYLSGYKWLENESAIVSDARLKDLQLSLALIDWKYWDEYYYMKRGEELDYEPEDIELLLQWEKNNMPQTIRAKQAILYKDRQDEIKFPGFIFLGFPLFDPIVLDDQPPVNCIDCPYFQVEQKTLRQLFKRKSGESGYEINREWMPPVNTEMNIIIIKNNFS